MPDHDFSHRLLFAGILLFFLALLTGLALPIIPYPKLGLGAHLTGLMNGMFLVLLGLLWSRLVLSARAASLTFGLVVYAAYANWIFSLLGSILGTGHFTPQASGGQTAAPWKELLVGAGLVTLALAMAAGCILLLVGLRRGVRRTEVTQGIQAVKVS
ncbi:MAG TPA: hydrogenase [Thermoanaerobaculia bacterium]|nr:hydrogenase [Thermoanaerobaculia bacterium]